MAKVKFDFSNVEDGFELMEAGYYDCYLFDVKHKETKKGDPMFVLNLKVAEGEHEGRQLFFNLPVMPQTLWKVKESLEAFGMDIPKSTVEVDFDNLLGNKVRAQVIVDEYQGEERNYVEKLMKYKNFASEPSSDDPF